MDTELRQQLIKDGVVSEEHLQAAETAAAEAGTSVEEILVTQGTTDFASLGQSLSSLYGLPYVALTGRSLSAAARKALSAACIGRWKTFPVDYEPRANLLTLAVRDLAQAETLERIYRFMLESYDVGFTVASGPEIDRALHDLFEAGGEAGSAETTHELPIDLAERKPAAEKKGKQMLSALHKRLEEAAKEEKPPQDTAGASLRSRRMQRPGVSRRAPRENADEPDASEALLQSLTSAVSLLVAAHLENTPSELARIRARARHCQLLATRLNLSPRETAASVLAAWLSGLENRRELIRQVAGPYDLEAIIFADAPDSKGTVEALIFTLVRCYQELEQESPADCRDVSLVRRGLHVRWSPAAEQADILEVFLQVLMDEQFLDKLDHATGTMLLLDPNGQAAAEIEAPLMRSGYKMEVIPSPAAARDAIASQPPDVLLVHAATESRPLLDLCKQLKQDAGTAGIPIVALVAPRSDVRGAEFLRHGVDDFLPIPVDMELLYLRVERLLSATSGAAAATGVTGSLSDLSFSDMLQVLSAGCRSMEISVSREGLQGRVFLKEGSVVHAELGETSGEQAFYQLMRWHDGEFSMKECSEFPASTVTSSTMSLLMEGARLADEGVEL